MASDTRTQELEAQLEAARKTINALVERVQEPVLRAELDRFAIYKLVAGLENTLRERTDELSECQDVGRALFDDCPQAILALTDGRIDCCNKAAELIFGKLESDLVGAPISALFDPASGAAFTGLVWSGFVGMGESEIVLADGRRFRFSVSRVAEARHFLVLHHFPPRQISDMEGDDTRRLAVLGRLASTVAHQINNPLAVILGRIELLCSVPAVDPDSLQRQLAVMGDHCRRISAIVRNLQAFARPKTPDLRAHGARQVLEEAVRTHTPVQGSGEVALEVQPPDLTVWADRKQLLVVVGNLLTNAAEMAGRARAVRLCAVPAADGKGGVRILVQAEGRTFPPEFIEDVSGPYPPLGRSAPLRSAVGLATAWSMLREHGGRLLAENAPGGGQLIAELPEPGPPPGTEVAVTPRSMPSGPLSILVVDDEQMLCETVTWMLAEDGHEILAVQTAEEALDRLASGQIDLVVTDLKLPGMDGEALIRAIEEGHPDLVGRTLLTSGLLHTPQPGTPYLQKPFTRAQLRDAIEALRA